MLAIIARDAANVSDFLGAAYAYAATWEVGSFALYFAVFGLVAWLVRKPYSLDLPKAMRNGPLASLVCGGAALIMAAGFGWKYRDLPPVFHDEYAYRFQAETFLGGTLRGVALPAGLEDCFDQPHVLTTPIFASRYYPGTALFLAPFVAMGMPWLANWLAAGAIAALTTRIGFRWSSKVGWLAGIIVAFAPATAAFANLQLSVVPATLALTWFLDAYLALRATGSRRSAAGAGLAMAAAFVTRPLTAVGIGLPFAFDALLQRFGSNAHWPKRWFATLVATFASGPLLLATYNFALTGNPLSSPYGVYMAERTPSQQYGFFNKSRGTATRGDLTFVAYDEWSEDLVPAMVPGIVSQRLLNVLKWTVGLIPGMVLTSLLLARLPVVDEAGWLIVLGCMGLAAAYAPYWFVGILGFSYLAEAIPFLSLALAVAIAGGDRRPGSASLWSGMLILAATLNAARVTPNLFLPGSEIVAPRLQAAQRQDLESKMLAVAGGKPILVIVDAKPSESLHTTNVFNGPHLDGQVVRAWNNAGKRDRLLEHFADRAVFLLKPGGLPARLR